jgi:uncharacterized protein YndB with AHSA1/START domain
VSRLEVTEHIAAPPTEVWDLIRDPTAMADVTEECVTMRWTGSWREPGLGARFRGHNRSGRRRWTTWCTVVRYEPGEVIAWDVAFGPLAVARWAYRLEAGGDGASTTVRESVEDHRSSALRVLAPLIRGTTDTDGTNRANMEATLARLKVRAEARRR